MSTALDTIKKAPLRQVQSVKELLMNDNAKGQLAAVAAKHMNPERMMRVVANAIRTTPKLQQCEPISFLGALMQCAALGLEPNTVLGHAYMIPFDNKRKGITEVQVVVGYKGLIDLARRSGHITSISANIHYSDDELWEYEEGTEATLRHRPGPQEGKKLHAYAIAKFKDGGHAYVVLPWRHVMKVRDGSQGYQTAIRYGKKDTPWITHEDAMAMKTAVRALSKYLPLSVEFADAMQVDEARADYRTFAMDPTAGVQVEADGETIDGESVDPETGEVSEVPAQIEHDRTPAATADKKPKAKEKERRDTGAYAEGAKKLDDAPKPAPVEEQPSMFADESDKPTEVDFSGNRWGQSFLTDVKDMGFDDAYSLHEAQFQQVKDEHPDFHGWLMERVGEIEAQG